MFRSLYGNRDKSEAIIFSFCSANLMRILLSFNLLSSEFSMSLVAFQSYLNSQLRLEAGDSEALVDDADYRSFTLVLRFPLFTMRFSDFHTTKDHKRRAQTSLKTLLVMILNE